MRYFTKNDINSEIINSRRQELLEDIDITLYNESDPFHSVIDIYFVNSKTKLESISNQIVEESDDYYYYQIPFENRGYGIIPRRVFISTNMEEFKNIVDDGSGNLYEVSEEFNELYFEYKSNVEEDGGEIIDKGSTAQYFRILEEAEEDVYKVGNIFYNSGVILLYHEYLLNELSTINISFKRKVQFLKREYYTHLNKNEFPTSSNRTYLDSKSPYPYTTNIILFNEDGEAIKKASLSQPIKTGEDMLLILEMFE